MNLTSWEEQERTNRGILWKAYDEDMGLPVYVVYIGKKRKPPKDSDFDFKLTKTGRTLRETAWMYVDPESPQSARRGAENLFKIHCI